MFSSIFGPLPASTPFPFPAYSAGTCAYHENVAGGGTWRAPHVSPVFLPGCAIGAVMAGRGCAVYRESAMALPPWEGPVGVRGCALPILSPPARCDPAVVPVAACHALPQRAYGRGLAAVDRLVGVTLARPIL